ncbi:Prolyl 3,4-dihydroxylase ofd1 [Grifola frondosa]|uniref:Prolyl 3,4-dihydroxylase ofd1 n=1 Tax=Grifola frondosa TaxID=5627 RepID=A0A1C7LZH2_GRIFR|nr:Prolyl 3,4-dihydroxylase ofd1 [Grifola frondosa]
MSVVSYRKSCHLLNHDDVIGTRRVSYILYMPLPHYLGWQKEWGGALELYPVKPGPDGVPEPEPVPAKTIPPCWNQFVFFEVQPGKSFHSVEEVVVGEGEDGRQRLSISGWFHSIQPGEEGYVPEDTHEFKSSREQLTSTQTEFKSYPDTVEPPLPDDPLSEAHLSFLSEFLNPVYLQPRTMKALAQRFVEESSLELHSFLCTPLADKLQLGLMEKDQRDGLGPDRVTRIPPYSSGGMARRREDGGVSALGQGSPDEAVRSLQDELFSSAAFRAWLAVSVDDPMGTAAGEEPERGWQNGEWGGWECYMAPNEEEDDPAVYRSGAPKKKLDMNVSANGHSKNHVDDEDMQEDSDEEDEEDGTLLTVQPGFNRLLLVLRDEGVMRFVKYVSAAAEGSRWDVCGEFEIGMVQEEESDS